MICSMTGYAVKTRDLERGTLQLELKSVNSRYLDFHFRVAEDLRAMEIPVRELLAARLSRGKIECRLSFNAAAARGEQLKINGDLLNTLRELGTKVSETLPDAAPLSVNEVLRWPGMFGEQGMDFAALGPEVLALAREALEDFTATRAREGAKLSAMITDRVNAMRGIVRDVAPRIPEVQAAFMEKLRQRLLDALGNASDDRVLQEVAVFATRIDVAEELTRLNTHLDEVERILKAGGACGKRLDFLMQELNREANTLASKSAVTEVSQAAMELKLMIEQMREQIQNLE
ncbi:YicC family protein [Azonexus hydrophilus]|uniref:YicC family protein n=1 Tax=Azonexus hydrophilus TaxID=418702 RepID=A0A1R1I2N3_9RHOO|nr:YicC/YloC family endoribonuclease [Azonexus hydrophilus]OMG53021.1 YicC family protein [Azonexus hydrophilus]